MLLKGKALEIPGKFVQERVKRRTSLSEGNPEGSRATLDKGKGFGRTQFTVGGQGHIHEQPLKKEQAE